MQCRQLSQPLQSSDARLAGRAGRGRPLGREAAARASSHSELGLSGSRATSRCNLHRGDAGAVTLSSCPIQQQVTVDTSLRWAAPIPVPEAISGMTLAEHHGELPEAKPGVHSGQ